MSQNTFESYLRKQQVSLQWLPVLRALATELVKSGSTAELHHLFFNVGAQLGRDYSEHFENTETLIQLEERVNSLWSRLNWGWVVLTEVDEVIEILHQAAPLSEAFGDESLIWSIGFLEGFYDTLFKQLGASEKMSVQALLSESAGMVLRLHLGVMAK